MGLKTKRHTRCTSRVPAAHAIAVPVCLYRLGTLSLTSVGVTQLDKGICITDRHRYYHQDTKSVQTPPNNICFPPIALVAIPRWQRLEHWRAAKSFVICTLDLFSALYSTSDLGSFVAARYPLLRLEATISLATTSKCYSEICGAPR